MARTKQTARKANDDADNATEAASLPPPAAPPPPPPPPGVPGDEAAAKKNALLGSKLAPRQVKKKSGRMFTMSQAYDNEAEEEQTPESRSALSFLSGEDMIVGKSRLKSVEKSRMKPVEIPLTADSFENFQKEKCFQLFAAKSYVSTIVLTKTLTRLSMAGLDRLNDIFFKLIHDSKVEMTGMKVFNCSGCPLVTDTAFRWLIELATNLREVKVAGCPKVTSATLSLLLKSQPSLTDLDMSGTGVTAIPTHWGNTGAGLKLDGCPLVCPPYFGFIEKFKTSVERSTWDTGVGLKVDGCSLVAPSFTRYLTTFTKERSSYIKSCDEGNFIHHVNQFKVIILRQQDLNFSIAKFLKYGEKDTTPDTGPLTVFNKVPFGDMHLNIFEIHRIQAIQDLILSDGCLCVLPFPLEECMGVVDGMVDYLSGKMSFILAKPRKLVPVLVGINTTGIPVEKAKSILDSVLAGVRKKVEERATSMAKQLVVMSRSAWRIDDLDVTGQIYVGKAAAMKEYLDKIKIFGEVLHSDQELDPNSFLHHAFVHFKEDMSWMCINSNDAKDLAEKHMMNHRISSFTDIAEKAHADAREISFHTNQMTYPCLEQTAIGLHQRGLAVFKSGVKGSPYVSDLDWFARVVAVVMEPPRQDGELAKQICFLAESTPVWTDKLLKEELGALVTAEQYLLLVKLLKSCGCLIEVKIDRLAKDMPTHVYVVSDKLPEAPTEVIDLEKLWPAAMDPRSTVQIDKFYRFTPGCSWSLLPKFFGRCAKFFRFTVIKKFGMLIRKGGVDMLVDSLPGINGLEVIFSARMENQPGLQNLNCRKYCLWSVMNLVTTIMDYCLQEEGIFANIMVPCPTCIPGREHGKIVDDPNVYRYYLHMISAGKDRGLKCHSPKYDCYEKYETRTQDMLTGPEMDFVPKHLSYMLAEVSSSLPKFSRCTLCQNCAVDGKKCSRNGLQEGSLCHCGCKRYPKKPICPGCGICWKCTDYLKKMYYAINPQSVRHIKFTAFEDEVEDGKEGKEEELKQTNNSFFQTTKDKMYVVKNVKFTPEKFDWFDMTTHRGNVVSIGIMGAPPKTSYGPLLTYSLKRGSIAKDWKFENPIATDPAWVGKNCTSVSLRLRYPDENDTKPKELGYEAVIVDVYKMGVKIRSEYLPALKKLEVAIYGEGSCSVILGTPTINTMSDHDRYHSDAFISKLHVELELDESISSKEGVLVCPIQSVRATGVIVTTDKGEPLLIKDDDQRIHPLGYTYNKRGEKKVYLYKEEKPEEPALEFENLENVMESVPLKGLMKKGKGKGGLATKMKTKPVQDPYVDVTSIYDLSKLVDQNQIGAAPLWMFSEVQRAGWEPSVIDVFGCKHWYQSTEALVSAFIRSKRNLEESIKKELDSEEGDGLAVLMFPGDYGEMQLRFQMRPRLQDQKFQLLPLCSSGSSDLLDAHLMNSPGVPIPLAVMKQTYVLWHLGILPMQVHMATEYRAVLPGYDALLGKLNLDASQVLYMFREALLQMAYTMMIFQAESRSPKPSDMQELRERMLTAVNGHKKTLGFKEDQEIKCPAHQLDNNINPTDIETVPGLKSYAQFLKKVKLSLNVESLPDGFLGQFKQMETFDTEGCPISELPTRMEVCEKLSALKLAGSKISSLPPQMSSLSHQLTYLDISKTNIRSALPDVLASLVSLRTLIADYLFLTTLPSKIGDLKHLEVLSLKGNPLQRLPESFTGLKKLTSLSLSGVPWLDVKRNVAFIAQDHFMDWMSHLNLAEDIMQRRSEHDLLMKITDEKSSSLTISQKEVGHLNALLYQMYPRFGFYGDQRPDAESVGGFPPEILELENLTHLDISYQGIVSVPDEISNLSKLTSLVLGPNPYLTTLPGAVGFLPLQKLVIDDCPSLRTPPPEICSKGFAAVLAYLRRLQAGSVSCKRTKLMMVGLGGAGKTSLVRALMSGTEKAQLASGEAITDGIDIHSWTIKRRKDAVTYSVWDFAGQTVYYNTHQFFLSNRAVYLLLWNIRLGYEHAGLDFWLSSISVHAPQAPILVVGTHLDLVSKYEIPVDELSARYPQIIGFHFISTYSGAYVRELQDHLLDITLQQKYMGEMIPEVWLNFEENILKERKGASVIDYDVVASLAVDSGIFETVETSQAVQFLHDLGTLQHFDNEFLKDRVVINPQWIVDVMACVVSVKDSFIENGRLKHKDIGHIWKDFPAELHEWLLRLTEEFDLTFPLPAEAMNLVPCLLPEKEPEINWPKVEEGSRETKMEYEFAYLPVGLFNRGQVRLYEYSDSSVIWKRGSLLKKNGHVALVTQTRDSKLLVKCQGPRPENILFMIHEVFETLIQESFQGVQYDFRVPCPECLKVGHEPFMFNGSTIRRATGLKAPFLQCVENFHIISIADLNGICPPDDSQDYDLHLQNTVRSLVDLREELSADIFISYCKADVPIDGQKMVEPKKIKDCLEAGGYRCWFEDYSDKDILEERVLALRDAKIFLVMISNNYINDQTCCNMFKFARTVLKKPIQLVTVGPSTGHDWKQSALGMLVADEVYVNLQRVEHFEAKSQELLKVLNDRTLGLVEADDKPECFISYCWCNSQRAVDLGQRNVPGAIGYGDPRDLKDYLEEKGVKTWLDIERAGKSGLFEDIAEGLRDAKVMIACVSDEYADSLNCQMEFRFAAKALNLPIIIAVYGTGHRWRSSEIGMLSLQYLQVSFQDRSESAADKVLQFVKSHIKSRDPREAARKKKAKDDANNRHQKTSYQELYELAQRKFLRQLTSYADVYELQPYPRLIIVDFAERESDSEENKEGDSKKEVSTERPKLVRRQTSLMMSATQFLHRNLCFRILCECEQGWHIEGDPIPAPPGWNQKVIKYAAYLARVMAVVRHSPKIQLNCIGGVEGDKYIKWLEEHGSKTTEEGGDVKEAYQELRKTCLEADTGKTLGGLSRCHLASGKVFWLCKNHQSQSGSRMTILSNSDATITHAPTDAVMDSFMLENLKPLDEWEKEAEVVVAEMIANPKPRRVKVATPESDEVAPEPTKPAEQPKPVEQPKPAEQSQSDEEKPHEEPKPGQSELYKEPKHEEQPGQSEPFSSGQSEPNQDQETEKPKPPERPSSARSRTSQQDAPVPSRRTSVTSTSSRGPSASSRASRRLSKDSTNSPSVHGTPRSVTSRASRRSLSAAIAAETVTAPPPQGAERKTTAAAQSKACYIL